MSIVNFDWDEMDVINTLKIREATERAIKTDSSGVKRVILSFDIEHIFDQRAKAREEAQRVYAEESEQWICVAAESADPITAWQRFRLWLSSLIHP